MKRSAGKMLHEFRTHWKNYVFQSLLAAGVIFAVLMCLSIQREAVIIASIGATAFIVFAMPNNITAQPRNIVGGYLVGLGCGFLSSFIVDRFFTDSAVFSSLIYALSVGLSIFIMVVIDMEHPPAAATALGVALRGFSLRVTIVTVACAIVLASVRYLFRRQLKDLT